MPSLEVELEAAFEGILHGAEARTLESQTLDFKQDDAQGEGATLKQLVDAAVCFANAGGGHVVLGVADRGSGSSAFVGTTLKAELAKRRIWELTKPGLVVEVSTRTIAGKQVLVLRVPEGVEVHADSKGRATHRIGLGCEPMSPAEIARLREERLGIDWSAHETSRRPTDISDLMLATIRERLGSFSDHRRKLAGSSREDILRALGLLTKTGHLTRAAEVLLCDPPGGQAQIVYQSRPTPGGEPRAVRLPAPLLSAFEQTMSLIAARQDSTPLNLPGGQVVAIEDFPNAAVREAIANAVIHRDYRLHGNVLVDHSPQVLAITSPGPLVSGVTPSNILTHPSKPRNPALANAFRLLGLAEEVGRGIDRMFKEMIRSGRDVPRIVADGESVAIRFLGGAPNKNIARFMLQLPEEERDDVDTLLILFVLCSKRTVTATRLSKVLQKSPDEVEVVLRRLAGSVSLIEPTRKTYRSANPAYRLRDQSLKALGTAVTYQRRTVDDVDRKVINHVSEYGKVTNRTLQNLFDLDVQRAKAILSDLVDRGILVKTSPQSRGPKIEYGPGPAFPIKKLAPEKAPGPSQAVGDRVVAPSRPTPFE